MASILGINQSKSVYPEKRSVLSRKKKRKSGASATHVQKSLRAFTTAKECLSPIKEFSMQFCCDIDVRLRSALGSRASGRGFDARLCDRLVF